MISTSSRAALRALFACAFVAAAGLLAGCDGVGPDASPIDLTVTATDATTPVDVDRPASITFTVSNPTSRAIAGVNVLLGGDGTSHMRTAGITCTAQGGTCPDTSSAWIPTYDMPAGSRFTFVASLSEVLPTVGDQTAVIDVATVVRTGSLQATAHVTAVDGRSGAYEIFAVSGLRTNLDVQFKSDTSTFSVSSGSVDKTMQPGLGDTYYTFPSGGHLSSAPDVLVGHADFGAGPETFIAVRNLVTALSDLDGKSFSTFHVVKGAAASASDAVSGTSGPLDLWQVAIAGSTLTVCNGAIGAIATCDAGHLRQYALSTPAGGGPAFTAVDSVHGDTFTFQVARSGASLIYLRADVAPADALFAIGFANAAPLFAEHAGYGTLNGVFGILDVTPTIWEFLDQKPAGDFGSTSPTTIAAIGNSIPGLMEGTRSPDGVLVYLLQQGALSLTGTPAGEFAIAADRLQ